MRQLLPPQENFKFFTGVLKAYERGGDRFISGIASDTLIDRDGDRMSPNAVKAMRASAEQNLTIFSNHHYDWEESLGTCVEADTYTTKGVEEQDVLSMNIVVKLEPETANPKTSLLYNKIQSGTKLGFSIGGQVRKAYREYDLALKRDVNIIDDVELVEISVVGIPANPRAMVSAVSKALKSASVLDVVDATVPTDLTATEESNMEGATESMNDTEVKAGTATAVSQPEVTAPQPEAIADAPLTKAGRAISSANEAKLRSILSTLQELLGGNESADAITKEEEEPKEEEEAETPAAPPAEEDKPAAEPEATPPEAEGEPENSEPATSDTDEEEDEQKCSGTPKPRKGVDDIASTGNATVRIEMDPDVVKAFTDLSDQLRAQQQETERLRALLEAKSSGRKGIVTAPTAPTDVPADEWANMSESAKNAMWVKAIFGNKKRG